VKILRNVRFFYVLSK